MTTTRDRHLATLLQDGRVLVVGGEDDQHKVLATAELYDPSTGSFSLTGSMAEERQAQYSTATLLLDGRVLMAGARGSVSSELYLP